MNNNFLQGLMIALIAALIVSISDGSSSSANDDVAGFKTKDEEAGLDKVVGVRRFLVQNQKKKMGGSYYYNNTTTCDKFPRVCRLKRNNNGGSDCCKNKRVDVKRDKMNCGKCGYKCKYSEICCEGLCACECFLRHQKRGGCNNKCNNGEFCVYGMCNGELFNFLDMMSSIEK